MKNSEKNDQVPYVHTVGAMNQGWKIRNLIQFNAKPFVYRFWINLNSNSKKSILVLSKLLKWIWIELISQPEPGMYIIFGHPYLIYNELD